MKQVLAVVLALSILLLAGCHKIDFDSTFETENTTLETTSSISSDLPALKQMPMAAISATTVNEKHLAEDKAILVNEIYQNISLITPDPDVANNVIIDYYQKTDVENSVATIKEYAQNSYLEQPQDFHPYLSQITYNPMRIDQGVLSLFGAFVSYSGTVHSDIIGRALTYNLISGDCLTLQDILQENVNADILCDLTMQALSERDDLFEGYEATVKDRFHKNLATDKDWYLSNNGLCFFFSPYEIGPYSTGIVVAEIPYANLTDILNNAYFPAEREQTNGAVEIAEFNEADLEKYSQFAELVISQESNKTLLYSTQGVYDVRIETGSWSADGATFTPEYTVLACYSLADGDAIMVDAPITDSLPQLRISYTSNNETIHRFIIRNGQTVSLVDIP